MSDYTIVLVAERDEITNCQGECHAYLGAYRFYSKVDHPTGPFMAGFFLGLYFKTLERALDGGYAMQVRMADLISGRLR